MRPSHWSDSDVGEGRVRGQAIPDVMRRRYNRRPAIPVPGHAQLKVWSAPRRARLPAARPASGQGSPLRLFRAPRWGTRHNHLETVIAMTNWTTDRATLTYEIPHWSNGYVDVAGNGHLLMRPRGDEGPALDLPAIVDKAP